MTINQLSSTSSWFHYTHNTDTRAHHHITVKAIYSSRCNNNINIVFLFPVLNKWLGPSSEANGEHICPTDLWYGLRAKWKSTGNPISQNVGRSLWPPAYPYFYPWQPDWLAIALAFCLMCWLASADVVHHSSQSEWLEYLKNVLTWNHQILHGHPCRPGLHLHQIWRHHLLSVGIYRSSKNNRKFRLRQLWSKFSGAAFYLPHQLVGLLQLTIQLTVHLALPHFDSSPDYRRPDRSIPTPLQTIKIQWP